MPKKARNPWGEPEESLAWEPPEKLTVSECADKYRVLSYKAEKRGPWQTSYNHVARAFMDSFGLDCVQEIWLVKPTQSSGTEGLLNMLLYSILQDPGQAMIVEPNENLAAEISQERIDDMISSSEKLKSLLLDTREETGKKKKTFIPMTVYFAWAGSPTSLASRACRIVMFDEVDKYREFTGKEASPLKLGKERTNTFKYTKKIVYVSTPVLETDPITVGEAGCEARFRYKIACPCCGAKQQFYLGNIKYATDAEIRDVEETAWYECESCRGIITDNQRMELVRRGDWYDTISGLSFSASMEKLKPRRIGFQFNRTYTPWFTFGDIAAEDLRTRHDVAARMNFVNSWLAEPWVEKAEQQTAHALYDRCIDIPAQVCPENTIAVTCGIDPSSGGYWFATMAWRKQGKERCSPHLIDYGFLKTREALQDYVQNTRYRIQGSDTKAFPLWRSGMDTGGTYGKGDETMTETAYAICRANKSYRLYGTKGGSVRGVAKMHETIIDKMPGKRGKVIPGGLTLWLLNSELLKQSCFDFLNFEKSEPGALTFHSEIDQELIDHLTAEEKRRDSRSKKWKFYNPPGRANHLFDALIIALAMGDPECNGGVNVLRRQQCYAVKHIKSQNIPKTDKTSEDAIILSKAKTTPSRWRIISQGVEI